MRFTRLLTSGQPTGCICIHLDLCEIELNQGRLGATVSREEKHRQQARAVVTDVRQAHEINQGSSSVKVDQEPLGDSRPTLITPRQ